MIDLSSRVALAPPLPLLIQLSSLSFILCGIHNDLFVIRFYVSLSYCLLIVNVLLSAHELLQLDNLLWSLLGLYINGTSLVALVCDERPVVLSADQAALWRLLYRSGGLSQRLFASLVAPHLQVQQVPAGEIIPTCDHFYLVYCGVVRLQVYDNNGVLTLERLVQSGQMFDLRYLELFSDYSDNFFKKGEITCTTVTECKLFRFTRKNIRKIAHHPLAKGVWQSLLINDIAIRADTFSEQPFKGQHCDSIFDPLQDWEMPDKNLAGSGVALRRPIRHFASSLWRSLLLPWPFGVHQQGIRQTLLPAPQTQKHASNQPCIRIPRQLIRSNKTNTTAEGSSFFLTAWTSRLKSGASSTTTSGENHEEVSEAIDTGAQDYPVPSSVGSCIEIQLA